MLAATSLLSPLCIERVLTQDGAAHNEAGLSFSVTPFWKDPHKTDIVVVSMMILNPVKFAIKVSYHKGLNPLQGICPINLKNIGDIRKII